MLDQNQNLALDIPAQPEYIGIARLMVAGVGNALAFNVDEIEDLKLAVGEACYQAFQSGLSEGSRLEIRSAVHQGIGLEFNVRVEHKSKTEDARRVPGLGLGERRLGLTLLNHLVDEMGFSRNCDSTTIRLLKRTPKTA